MNAKKCKALRMMIRANGATTPILHPPMNKANYEVTEIVPRPGVVRRFISLKPGTARARYKGEKIRIKRDMNRELAHLLNPRAVHAEVQRRAAGE